MLIFDKKKSQLVITNRSHLKDYPEKGPKINPVLPQGLNKVLNINQTEENKITYKTFKNILRSQKQIITKNLLIVKHTQHERNVKGAWHFIKYKEKE